MKRYLARLNVAALLVTVPLLAGCPNPVDPTTPDVSPPDLNLDAFGIPVQPGASSQPNPESLNPTCCDVTRTVKPGKIDLIAGAKDPQSGVQTVSIWVVNASTTCVDASGIATKIGPGLVSGPVAQNPPKSASSATATPTSAPDQLLVQHALTIPGPGGCAEFFAEMDVFAESENSAGLKVRTKRFTFKLQLP